MEPIPSPLEDFAGSPVTVELRLIPAHNAHGTVHVEGTARVDGGAEQAFSGWMALLQILEGMVDNRR